MDISRSNEVCILYIHTCCQATFHSDYNNLLTSNSDMKVPLYLTISNMMGKKLYCSPVLILITYLC